MKCKKCDYELKENWKICPKCSEIVETVVTINLENNGELDDKKLKELKKDYNRHTIYFVIFFISLFCVFFVPILKGVFFLVSLVTIVGAFLSYPNKTFVKMTFWLFLVAISIFGMLIMWLIYQCFDLMRSCS